MVWLPDGEHKRFAVFSLSIVMQYITPGYASTGYVATEACYYLAPPSFFKHGFHPMLNIFLSIHKNTEWISAE